MHNKITHSGCMASHCAQPTPMSAMAPHNHCSLLTCIDIIMCICLATHAPMIIRASFRLNRQCTPYMSSMGFTDRYFLPSIDANSITARTLHSKIAQLATACIRSYFHIISEWLHQQEIDIFPH